MRKTLVAGALAALALAVGGAAVARQSPDLHQARGLRADADGDQRLSRAEFVDARIQRLAAAGADRDGSVTPDERRAAAEARRASRVDARFDRLDADNDGVISKAEFEARREHRAEARGHRGPHRVHRRAAQARGMAERGPVVISEAQARAEAAFTRLDVDGDGFVTAAERQAVRADRRGHRRERMAERRAARRAQQASPSAAASE